MKHTFLSLLSLLLALPLLRGQDEYFSQYDRIPLTLNAANTGRQETTTQLTVMHRSQWNTIFKEGYQASYAALESKIFCFGPNFFGLGFSASREEAGEANFVRQYAELSGAYHMRMSRKVQMSAGGAFSLTNHGVDFSSLTFDEQFDGDSFNPTLSAQENFNTWTALNVDAAVGWMLYALDGTWSVGFGLDHVLTPSVSFFGQDLYTLSMGMTVHGNYVLPVRKDMRVNLHAMVKDFALFNNTQWIVVGGADVIVDLGDQRRNALDSYVRVGVSGRLSNRAEPAPLSASTVVVSGSYRAEGWELGASLDLALGKLALPTSGLGALEIFLGIPIVPRSPECVLCPRL